MRELNESFRIKLNDVKVNYKNEFSTIPYGIYGLDLSSTEFKIIIALYSVKDILKGKENDKFKRSFIAKHLNMDMSNFNKSFNKLIEREYLLVDENNELIINHKLIRGLCSDYIKKNVNHLYGGTKKDLIKIIDEKDREADLRVYNKLKKYIDNGVADDEDKAEFAILSNKLGYSNNNDLENNFNNTKTEDYVTTIRTNSNTINTSDNSNDNHIPSNEEESEEDLYFQYGEDGFGEDRDDDMQEKINQIRNAELRIEDLERLRGNFNGFLEYKVPVNELDVEDTPKEEVKPTQPIHKPVENNKEFGDDAFDLTQFDGIF